MATPLTNSLWFSNSELKDRQIVFRQWKRIDMINFFIYPTFHREPVTCAYAKQMNFQTQDGEHFFDENQHGIEGFMKISVFFLFKWAFCRWFMRMNSRWFMAEKSRN